MSREALDELRNAVKGLKLPVESRRDLSRLEVTLDGITSALRPFWNFPDHLQDEAALFDEVMAYLSSQGEVSSRAAEAASHLLWCAGLSPYEWATTGNILEDLEQSRGDVYKELKTLYEQLREQEEEEAEDG